MAIDTKIHFLNAVETNLVRQHFGSSKLYLSKPTNTDLVNYYVFGIGTNSSSMEPVIDNDKWYILNGVIQTGIYHSSYGPSANTTTPIIAVVTKYPNNANGGGDGYYFCEYTLECTLPDSIYIEDFKLCGNSDTILPPPAIITLDENTNKCVIRGIIFSDGGINNVNVSGVTNNHNLSKYFFAKLRDRATNKILNQYENIDHLVISDITLTLQG